MQTTRNVVSSQLQKQPCQGSSGTQSMPRSKGRQHGNQLRAPNVERKVTIQGQWTQNSNTKRVTILGSSFIVSTLCTAEPSERPEPTADVLIWTVLRPRYPRLSLVLHEPTLCSFEGSALRPCVCSTMHNLVCSTWRSQNTEIPLTDAAVQNKLHTTTIPQKYHSESIGKSVPDAPRLESFSSLLH